MRKQFALRPVLSLLITETVRVDVNVDEESSSEQSSSRPIPSSSVESSSFDTQRVGLIEEEKSNDSIREAINEIE